jgi:FkbM family methyltransferase
MTVACAKVGGSLRYRIRKIRRAGRVARQYALGNDGEREFVRRGLFFDVARDLTPLMAVDTAEGTLLVGTQDIDLGRETFLHRAWERDEADLIVREAERASGRRVRGATVVEVGANIGTTTLLMLNRYGAERVIAFEPHPQSARILRAMVALNNLEDRVDVRQVALGHLRSSTLTMELSNRSPGDNRIRTRPPADSQQGEDKRDTTEVSADTLDAQLDSLNDVALVWIDAQGYEGHILAGATRLLENDAPVVTEFWPYALRRTDGLELLLDLIARHYTTVIDTHHGTGPERIRDITQLARRYPGAFDFTDLVLVKPASRGTLLRRAPPMNRSTR